MCVSVLCGRQPTHRSRIDRALTGAASAGRLRRVSRPNVITAHSPLNAVSAALFGHRPADRRGHLRRGPEAGPSQAASITNGIVALRGRNSTAQLLSLPGTAFTSSTLRAINARVASHILVGLSSNALVRYVAGDRAPTCPAADRRKTKPSDREARARRCDRDRPTPKGTAERSARA